MSDARNLPLEPHAFAARIGSFAQLWQIVMVLFKLRIVVLLLFAAMGGAFIGAGGVPPAGPLVLLLLSGAASAAGASALNQVIERERDALMRRTRRRPLPTGVLRRPWLIWLIGGGLIVGSVAAVLPINPAMAFFLALGAFIYVGVYTLWLKPRSIVNIVIGGAAGSCAVLSGGAAVGHWADAGVLALAGLLFTWTPMHFWSLALIYRDDYAATGVPMLPVSTSAVRSAWWVLLHGMGTAAIALRLASHPALGWLYFVPTTVVTIWMIACGVRFLLRPQRREAMDFFKASNLYLALVLLFICGAASFS